MSCATQYTHLLENVEKTRHKKRKPTQETDTMETPEKLVVDALTQARIKELIRQMKEGRREYMHLKEENHLIETGQADDRLPTLLKQIEEEETESERDAWQQALCLKERKERKKLGRPRKKHRGVPAAANQGCGKLSQTVQKRSSSQSEPSSMADSAVDSLLSESLNVDVTGDESAPRVSMAVKPAAAPTPTSPLLTSLLKSPSQAPALQGVSRASSILHSAIMNPHVSVPGLHSVVGCPPAVSSSLKNLVSSAIRTGEEYHKPAIDSPAAGAPTLSMLLELPPSLPGKHLPELPTAAKPTIAIAKSAANSCQISVAKPSIVTGEVCHPQQEELRVRPEPGTDEHVEVVEEGSTAQNRAVVLTHDIEVMEVVFEEVVTVPDVIPPASTEKPPLETVPKVESEEVKGIPELEVIAEEVVPAPEVVSSSSELEPQVPEAVVEKVQEISVKPESMEVESLPIVEEEVEVEDTIPEVAEVTEVMGGTSIRPAVEEEVKGEKLVLEEAEPEPVLLVEEVILEKELELQQSEMVEVKDNREIPIEPLKEKKDPIVKTEVKESQDSKDIKESKDVKKVKEGSKHRDSIKEARKSKESPKEKDGKKRKEKVSRDTGRDHKDVKKDIEAKESKDRAIKERELMKGVIIKEVLIVLPELTPEEQAILDAAKNMLTTTKTQTVASTLASPVESKILDTKIPVPEEMPPEPNKPEKKVVVMVEKPVTDSPKPEKSKKQLEEKSKKPDEKDKNPEEKNKKMEEKGNISKEKSKKAEEKGKISKKKWKEVEEKGKFSGEKNKKNDEKRKFLEAKHKKTKDKANFPGENVVNSEKKVNKPEEKRKIPEQKGKDMEDKVMRLDRKEDDPEENSTVAMEPEAMFPIEEDNAKDEVGKTKMRPETLSTEDDKTNDTESPRPGTSRKRVYTCTPVDSVPNSPATTMDDESQQYRKWKKSIMMVYNRLATHKLASLFLRPITDEQAPGYSSVIHRPMDLGTIKRSIDQGTTSTRMFQRDVMLMFQNALMYNKTNDFVNTMAGQMQDDVMPDLEVLVKVVGEAPLKRETRTSEIRSIKAGEDSELVLPKRKRDPETERSIKKRKMED